MRFKVNDMFVFKNDFQKEEILNYFKSFDINVKAIGNYDTEGFMLLRENYKQTKMYLAIPRKKVPSDTYKEKYYFDEFNDKIFE